MPNCLVRIYCYVNNKILIHFVDKDVYRVSIKKVGIKKNIHDFRL